MASETAYIGFSNAIRVGSKQRLFSQGCFYHELSDWLLPKNLFPSSWLLPACTKYAQPLTLIALSECRREAATEAKMRFAVGNSDFLAALNAYRQWNAIERKGDQRKFCAEVSASGCGRRRWSSPPAFGRMFLGLSKYVNLRYHRSYVGHQYDSYSEEATRI